MIITVSNKQQQQSVLDFFQIFFGWEHPIKAEEFCQFIVWAEEEDTLTLATSIESSMIQKDKQIHTFEEFVCFVLANYKIEKEKNDGQFIQIDIFKEVFRL